MRDAYVSFTALAAALVCGGIARGDIRVAVERSEQPGAGFNFRTVPSPSQEDAAARATFTIVDGHRDPRGGDVDVLHDGTLPGRQDEPSANCFFDQGLDGGRLVVDLGRVIEIGQINTYSWHPESRGPQVYSVYGADGAASAFNAAPNRAVSPSACGWTFITDVDTRPRSEPGGGQYGVSISDCRSAIGRFRYLLFDITETEEADRFGNTFYSEIDVLASATAAAVTEPSSVCTPDGKYEFSIDTSESPDLRDWARNVLTAVILEWYPKIVDTLPGDGFEAPVRVMVVFQDPGQGVAATSGSRITCAAPWFRKNIEGEAPGAVVHELVHVVQRYGATRRATGDASDAPGWLTEGIADYVRWFLYEPQVHGADHVHDPAKARYNAGYRVSANFLNWVSVRYDKHIVRKLNAALREGTYGESIWKSMTGKRLEDLGNEWRIGLSP